MSAQAHLRCRLGLHRWAQFEEEDPDLADPGASAVWVTKCRYCGAERGSGVAFMASLVGVLSVAGVVLWLLVSPILGALMLLGAVGGAGSTARMVWWSGYSGRARFRYRG